MAAYNVDLEKVEELVSLVNQITGEQLHNCMMETATLVQECDNQLLEEMKEHCVTMQSNYNDKMVPAYGAMLDELDKFPEFVEVLKKRTQSLTEVSKIEAEQNVAAINVPQL